MNMKFVSVRVEGELYKKLVEYAMEKCTIFSLTFRHDQHKELRQNVDHIAKKYKNLKNENLEEIAEKEKVDVTSLEYYIYEENKKNTLKKLKKYKRYEYYKSFWDGIQNKEKPYITKYFFKLDKELKDFFLEKISIEDWIFYKELEDLSFYRGKDESSCLFRSVSHEGWSWINWNSEEEYKYLKSIGIKIRGDGSKPVKLE